MKNKFFFILLTGFLAVLISPLDSEIIQFSKLKKKKDKFIISRDLFSPHRPVSKIHIKPIKIKKTQLPPPKKAQKNIVDEVQRRFIYEGYILKNQNDKSNFIPKKPETRWVYVLKDDKKEDNKKKEQSNAVIIYNDSHALINVDGEYYVVTAGDIILENILIVQIEEIQITLDVDSQIIKIQLKDKIDG